MPLTQGFFRRSLLVYTGLFWHKYSRFLYTCLWNNFFHRSLLMYTGLLYRALLVYVGLYSVIDRQHRKSHCQWLSRIYTGLFYRALFVCTRLFWYRDIQFLKSNTERAIADDFLVHTNMYYRSLLVHTGLFAVPERLRRKSHCRWLSRSWVWPVGPVCREIYTPILWVSVFMGYIYIDILKSMWCGDMGIHGESSAFVHTPVYTYILIYTECVCV